MNRTSLYILITLIIGTTVAVWYSANKVTPGKSFDTIIVGTNTELPPFSFKKDDKVVGFDIDVITEAVKRLNKKIVLKDMPFDELIPEIQIGNIHVIAAGMTPTPEREQRTLFTQPHLSNDSSRIENSAFCISKHYPELRDYIQIMLDRMQQDGTLYTLKKKWNLS
jgi:ABC-type amino acid transport substrate-binding protein